MLLLIAQDKLTSVIDASFGLIPLALIQARTDCCTVGLPFFAPAFVGFLPSIIAPICEPPLITKPVIFPFLSFLYSILTESAVAPVPFE